MRAQAPHEQNPHHANTKKRLQEENDEVYASESEKEEDNVVDSDFYDSEVSVDDTVLAE